MNKFHTYMMLKDGAKQTIVFIEIVYVVLPEISRRENETIVLGKENIFLWSLYVIDM